MTNKRGQITIFIIIGIIIVGLAIVIYLVFPQIKTKIGLSSKNPSSFMQACMEDSIKETVKTISSNGGSINPKNYVLYNNNKIEYLCYTNEYYKTCVVQRPLLKRHIEEEIEKEIKDEAKNCLDKLKENYESRGYNVNIKDGNIDVELLPEIIAVNFNNSVVLTKDPSEKYDLLRISVKNNLYELISIANSIIQWEASYGDAETTTYMNYYHDLKVEKKKQSDGTTIYILTNRNTGDKFQFASRSLAWPPGYGAEGVA